MQKKLLSIIVPIYNVEKYLRKSLDSIVNNLPEGDSDVLEVIMIDDVSPDNSLTIALEYKNLYPHIFRLVNHKDNLGLGGARNTGIDSANAKFLMFLDSDDWLETSALTILFERLRSLDDTDVLIYGLKAVKTNEVMWEYRPPDDSVITSEEALLRFSKDQIIPSACNKIFPRKLIGDLRFTPHTYYEDLEFCPQIINRSRNVKFLDLSLLNYRLEGESITRQTIKNKHVLDLAYVLQTIRRNIKDRTIVSNFFLDRWAFQLKKWNPNEELFSLALKEMVKFLGKHSLDEYDAAKKTKFTNAITSLYEKYHEDADTQVLYHALMQKIEANCSDFNPTQKVRIPTDPLQELLVEINDLHKQKEWYEKTYESLPWWWKKVGAAIRRLKIPAKKEN